MKKQFLLFITLIWISQIKAQTGITIGNQVWMNRNLDVATYRNGDPIPHVTDDSTWEKLTTGAWCYYKNDSATYGAVYGKLYNWYAVNDPRGLAPAGWHVASDSEWIKLDSYLGGYKSGEGALKEKGKTHWHRPNLKATNSSGFTGLPGGWRDDFRGHFKGLSYLAYWWTSTRHSEKYAYARQLEYLNGFLTGSFFPPTNGFSVRCVKD